MGKASTPCDKSGLLVHCGHINQAHASAAAPPKQSTPAATLCCKVAAFIRTSHEGGGELSAMVDRSPENISVAKAGVAGKPARSPQA
jgi:hypothetical protein